MTCGFLKVRISANRLTFVLALITLVAMMQRPSLFAGNIIRLTAASQSQVDSALKFTLVNNDSEGKDVWNVMLQAKLSFNVSFEIITVADGTFDSVGVVSADTIEFAASEILYDANKTGAVLVRLNGNSTVTLSVEETVYVEKAYDPSTQEVIVVDASDMKSANCLYDAGLEFVESTGEILQADAESPGIVDYITDVAHKAKDLFLPKPDIQLQVEAIDNLMGAYGTPYDRDAEFEYHVTLNDARGNTVTDVWFATDTSGLPAGWSVIGGETGLMTFAKGETRDFTVFVHGKEGTAEGKYYIRARAYAADKDAALYLLSWYDEDGPKSGTIVVRDSNQTVGGIVVPVDKFGLLAPYIDAVSTIIAATVVTAIYAKRVKRRKEQQ